MDPFLDLDKELEFSQYEVRSLIEGRVKILAELEKLGPGGNLADPAHEQRYDGLIDRATKLDAYLDSAKRVEKRSSALAALRANGNKTTGSGVPAVPPPANYRAAEPAEERDLLENLDGGKHKYSILKAVECIRSHRPVDGLEAEVSQEIEKRTGKAATGFYVPWTLPIYGSAPEQRAFDSTAGTGLIPKIQARTLVDVLRNRMVMARMGATIMSGMVGIFDLPKKTATSAAYWVAEAGAPTASNVTVGQIEFTPTTVGAYTDVTRRLINQSSFDAEKITRDDILAVLQLELDRVGLNGSGSSNQPKGILQDSGVSAVSIGTDGGALTFAKLVELETAVAAANADLGTLGYVTSAKGRGQAKTIKKDAGSGIFLWENDEMNGYRAMASNQIPSDLEKGDGENLTAVIFGNFADAVYAMWGGIDMNIDPYSLSTSGGVRIVMLADCQFKLRRTESFAKIVDAATT